MAKAGYIYKYKFPNGKVYIGQTTKSIEETRQQLMTEAKDPKKRTLFQLAIAKYGEPEFEILECFKVGDGNTAKLVTLVKIAALLDADIKDLIVSTKE